MFTPNRRSRPKLIASSSSDRSLETSVQAAIAIAACDDRFQTVLVFVVGGIQGRIAEIVGEELRVAPEVACLECSPRIAVRKAFRLALACFPQEVEDAEVTFAGSA